MASLGRSAGRDSVWCHSVPQGSAAAGPYTPLALDSSPADKDVKHHVLVYQKDK